MFCAIDMVAVPITIGCIFLGMVAIAGIALYDQRRKHHHRPLPHGAEAALWSVIEVLPDPRNHLAIKDPTSELRLTAEEKAEALAAAAAARSARAIERPAAMAAAARSASAREAALAKHDEAVREKQRRVLASREPSAFDSPEVVDRIQAMVADAELALAIDLREKLPKPATPAVAAASNGPDTGELHAVHPRAS